MYIYIHTHTYICWTVLTPKPHEIEYFPTRPALPTSPTVGTVNFYMVKLPGLCVNHPRIYSGEINERVGISLYTICVFLWPFLG